MTAEMQRQIARFVAVRYIGALAIGDLVWELLHLPLYTLWQTASVGYLMFAALHCWIGDILIGAASLGLRVVVAGRHWPSASYARVATITVLIGVAYTVFSEWLNVTVRGSWDYASAMPRIPPFGTGLSPLLQWIIVPVAAFAWAKRRLTQPQGPLP